LSAEAAGAPPAAGVPGAVAVELVHNFSLLHDDIMDRDAERRHRPTAWHVFGTSPAILAGDALLTLAVDVLLEAPSPYAGRAGRCLTSATQRLITGQASDLEFEERDDVTLDECLAMASDKTGALIGCASAIGALLAGAPPRLTDGLAAFGVHLGLAFQLVDDLLGIWGSPEVTGKPVLSDLRARKKSLPVVAALAAGSPHARRLAELYGRLQPLTEAELTLSAGLVEDAGGREWSERQASHELAEAERALDGCLDRSGHAARVRGELMEIARFVTDRDS
ncbi:MAG: polyprenyl synthetase family protein, partial [Carbonactinosporaceae bacterium]